MQTKELEMTKVANHSVQLVKGEFTSLEALDIVIALIDEKINFHKLQRLQIWEGNHVCKTDYLNDRIVELEQEKQAIKDFISKTRIKGAKLKIKGTLELKVID